MLDLAKHGICGRAVLLDIVEFYTADGSALPYNPWSSHPFTVADLEECAKKEGVVFRRGDILLLRGGFTQKYYTSIDEERQYLVTRKGAEQL